MQLHVRQEFGREGHRLHPGIGLRRPFGLIEDRTGRRAVKRRDVVSLRSVPEDVAPLLALEAGTLALTMANTYWDQHRQVTECARDFMGPDRELAADYDLE
ncbi:UTRA domain-containing protein [Streptomyces sp. NPDC002677]|uniref:UTRA domain-containing protein n=1 Tax=Streptomyces sp. NPDC002677 TaxID=3154774 RepID=UPI00332616C6